MTTRAALLTPPGVSAIASIQIQGPRSLDVLATLFRPCHNAGSAGFRVAETLHYGRVYDNEEVLDAVIVATDPVHKIVDIHCHGGPRIVQRLLMLLKQQEVEILPWQHLPPCDSIADEVQATLPLAKTRQGVLAIAAQTPGGLSNWIRSRIRRLEAHAHLLGSVQDELQGLLARYDIAHTLLHCATVVLVGPVNAGKSTLANALTGRRQSITSEVPGTTRDWTAQLVNIHGVPVYLVDTPGRRDEQGDAIEEHALRVARHQIDLADLIVLVIEAGESEEEHIAVQRAALPADKDILIVANKIDRQSSPCTPKTAQARADAKEHIYYISALQEMNLESLRVAIADSFGMTVFDPEQPMIFTQRQFDILSRGTRSDCSRDLIEILQETLGASHR